MSLQRRSTRHRLTRLGWQFMLIGMFGMLGGSLNGLNLLIVVAAVCIAVLLAQWRLSRAIIDAVRIDRRLPAEVFAGKAARLRFQVSNRHPLMPLWLVGLNNRVTRFSSESGAMNSDASSASPMELRTGVGLLLPGQTTSAFLDATFLRRGRYRLDAWTVSTTAPFALSTAWRDALLGEEFLDVYPSLLPLSRSWRQRLPTKVGNVSSSAQRQGPADEVFFGLREYRRGDNRRQIHWRTTARIGELVVRQFEQQRRLDLCFVVDAFGESSTPNDPEVESRGIPHHRNAEKAISLAASLVVALFGGSGSQIMLSVAGRDTETTGGGLSREALRRMLKSMASTQVTATPDLKQSLDQVAQAAKHLPDLVVISPRSLSDAMASGDDNALALRRWQQRGRLNWINVSGRDAASWIADGTVPANGTVPADGTVNTRNLS